MLKIFNQDVKCINETKDYKKANEFIRLGWELHTTLSYWSEPYPLKYTEQITYVLLWTKENPPIFPDPTSWEWKGCS
jgi:hypothetical protein